MKKAKENKIPQQIVKLYQKLRRINGIYIDTCFVGYLTDDYKHKERGDLIVKYIQNYNIMPYFSDLVLEELSAVESELDDDKKIKKLVKLWMKVLKDINAKSVVIDKVSDEEKEFNKFLIGMGISKNDAIHFTITVFHDIDAFLSFNKKIFVKRKKKIDRNLMFLRRKTPLIFQVNELYEELKKLDKYGLI